MVALRVQLRAFVSCAGWHVLLSAAVRLRPASVGRHSAHRQQLRGNHSQEPHGGASSGGTAALPDPRLPDAEYFPRLRELILKTCGSTCEYAAPVGRGKFFDRVRKAERCESLFSDGATLLDGLSNRWPPPRHIPDALLADFTMGNTSMRIEDLFKMQRQGGKEHRPQQWHRRAIDTMVTLYKRGDFVMGRYTKTERRMIYDLLLRHNTELSGKHCAVIGSQSPWVESLVLAAGAAHVTTVEYSEIETDHPQIDTMKPSDWGAFYRANGRAPVFDCVVTYSSLEHAGLGRYGDIINPWGDLMAMGKIMCSLKKGGLVFIGFASTDEDGIAWNSHRYYGPRRWAQMLANSEQIDYIDPPEEAVDFSQGMVVARKS